MHASVTPSTVSALSEVPLISEGLLAPALPDRHASPDDWGRSPSSLFNRRTGALAGVAIAAVAGTGLIRLADQPATYEGTFQLLIEPAGTIEPAAQTVTNQAAFAAPSVDYASQIQVLWSHQLLSPVVQQLQAQYADLTYETLSQTLDIAHRDGEKTLELTYQDADPKKVQAVLEKVSQAYLQYSQTCRTSLCRELDFVERRLPQLQQQVTVAKQNLQTLQQQHGISEPTALGKQLSQRLGMLTQQRQDLQIRLTEARTQAAILEKRTGEKRDGQTDAGQVEQTLKQNDRYQALLAQFQTIADQLTVELARPQPDSTMLQTLKQRYQQVSAQMTQAAQQPIAIQLAQAIADFQADKTTDYTAVTHQQTLLEGVTAAAQVQALATSQQAIVQTEGQIKQQIKQWAALARQYDELNLELKFATDNLNLYQTKRASLRQVVPAQTQWQLTEAPAVEQVSHGFTLSDPEHRLSLGLMLSFLLVVFVTSVAEQATLTRSPGRRRPSLQPEFSWQTQLSTVQPWQPSEVSEPQAMPSLLAIPNLTMPLHDRQTTLFLLTAATRIEARKRAAVTA